MPHALIAGVADDQGYGYAIYQALRAAGWQVTVACWPPAMGILQANVRMGRIALDAEILPLDAAYDTYDDIPADTRVSRRYRDHGDVSIQGLADRVGRVDLVVHSLANGPEVDRPLLQTSRAGYLSAVGVSAYSFVSMVQRIPADAYICLSYMAAVRAVPGYGGGMSSAKAALESDTRTLAIEAAPRRVNAISAGVLASRAARSIPGLDSMLARPTPLADPMGESVGAAAVWLATARGVTGHVLYVDNGAIV